MSTTITGDWVPFGKPIKYLNTSYRPSEEGLLLAWRPYYYPQPKAFEPIAIQGIEYLDTAGDIVDFADVEFLYNLGSEQ